MILTIKKIKYDKNGNPRFNIKLSEKDHGVLENRTADFLKVCFKHQLLKNGSLNITGYKSNVIAVLKKRSTEIYNDNNFDIIEL